jgi:ABC-type branched-subunit amino acid transport system permease subunit
METSRTHVALTIAAVLALLLLTDPFMVLMPDMAQMIVLALATALICGWVGLVMLEKDGDEREATHRMYAARAAYLSGVSILTVALVYQGYQSLSERCWSQSFTRDIELIIVANKERSSCEISSCVC